VKIYLLRHAKAELGFPDAERSLSGQGRDHARRLGRFFRGREYFQPALLWCSPLVRAQETAEIFLKAWGNKPSGCREVEALEPEMNPASLVGELEAVGQDVLVVGHNPNLTVLASLLLNGEQARTRVHLKTSGLICLKWSPVPNFGQTGPCELCWMLDPRVL